MPMGFFSYQTVIKQSIIMIYFYFIANSHEAGNIKTMWNPSE